MEVSSVALLSKLAVGTYEPDDGRPVKFFEGVLVLILASEFAAVLFTEDMEDAANRRVESSQSKSRSFN